MNNRDVNPDFHGLKSSEGDAAAMSGVCMCAGGRGAAHTQTHTHPHAGWELVLGQRSLDELCAHLHQPSGHRRGCLGKGGEAVYDVGSSAP